MIKLKTLILEGRTVISKMEEGYALKIIIIKLLPGVVNLYNWVAKTKWGVPQITEEEVRKQFKKIKVEHFTNGQEIEYDIKLPGTTISFKIQKLNHETKYSENKDKIVFKVGYYNFALPGWADLSWNLYDVEGLARGDYGDFDIDPAKFM